MGMSDQQFEVYNALIIFVDELIDRETDEKEKEKLAPFQVTGLDILPVCLKGSVFILNKMRSYAVFC